MGWKGPLDRVDDYRWRIPPNYKPGMRVPGLIYADARMLETIRQDQAPEQVANVACLPGIVGASLAMPDIHWGYGFPIGGVAAFDAEQGVVSPGGVGYDINCGVRLLTSDLEEKDLAPRRQQLVDELFRTIPTGVGVGGKIRLGKQEMKAVLEQGARWAVEQGYGWQEDLERTEEGGAMAGADASRVSDKAIKRGADQLGTLGSGNHFLEVSVVQEIYDPRVAEAFGLRKGQVVALIHSGSRGLGHQVCTDYLQVMGNATRRYGISLPDRQLACAPVNSPEARDYLAAMAAASNYAWANRQCLTHWTREVFSRVFGQPAERLGLVLLYDQAHNIAKFEEHVVEGKRRKLCVHRKGATRAFGPGRAQVPARYRAVGQPVLVPGDMGRYSYILVGTDRAMEETFGSASHGAGRLMSRSAVKKGVSGARVRDDLAARGILVKAESNASLAEEAPEAYKDVASVVNITHESGVARRVARIRPVCVIKG